MMSNNGAAGNRVEIGARVPRSARPVLSWLALRLLALLGWRLDVHLPDEPKLVVLAAPHTSNWDGFFAILAMLAMDLRLGLFVKHTAFDTVLGGLLRKLDAIPIDRTAASGLVTQTVDAFNTRPQLMIGLAPEGTRHLVKKWKRGFYLIAQGAQVPIICAYVDYGRKTIGSGLCLKPTGDYTNDLASIQAFYRTITPKCPERFSAAG